jgi:hypothetical protein
VKLGVSPYGKKIVLENRTGRRKRGSKRRMKTVA